MGNTQVAVNAPGNTIVIRSDRNAVIPHQPMSPATFMDPMMAPMFAIETIPSHVTEHISHTSITSDDITKEIADTEAKLDKALEDCKSSIYNVIDTPILTEEERIVEECELLAKEIFNSSGCATTRKMQLTVVVAPEDPQADKMTYTFDKKNNTLVEHERRWGDAKTVARIFSEHNNGFTKGTKVVLQCVTTDSNGYTKTGSIDFAHEGRYPNTHRGEIVLVIVKKFMKIYKM
jgi:hypothetical protein